MGRTGNSEVQCFLPANVTEAGGYLGETVKVDSSCAGFSYTSGAIQMRSYSFTYGRVDVRAKFAGGTGPWPAIWLLGANCQPWRMYVNQCAWPQPGSDEIDIAEILNSNHTVVHEQIHATAAAPSCDVRTTDVSLNWHVYTLIWAPGKLTFEIDGAVTCTMTQAVPSHPMFLIINTSLGGTGGGTVVNSTLPQTTLVDYVRVTPQ